MKSIGLAAVGLLALVGTAHAQRESKLSAGYIGNLCISKEASQVEACRAYLTGISDAIGFYQRLVPADGSKGSKLPEYVCIPGATTGPQLQETYVSWLKAHKDAQRELAVQATLRALNDKFLCPSEKK